MNVKDAIGKAKAYLLDLYPDIRESDLELEETEFLSGEWRITLSFHRPMPASAPTGPSALEILAYAQGRARRVHKVLVVLDDGDVVAMKDRAWMERAG